MVACPTLVPFGRLSIRHPLMIHIRTLPSLLFILATLAAGLYLLLAGPLQPDKQLTPHTAAQSTTGGNVHRLTLAATGYSVISHTASYARVHVPLGAVVHFDLSIHPLYPFNEGWLTLLVPSDSFVLLDPLPPEVLRPGPWNTTSRTYHFTVQCPNQAGVWPIQVLLHEGSFNGARGDSLILQVKVGDPDPAYELVHEAGYVRAVPTRR